MSTHSRSSLASRFSLSFMSSLTDNLLLRAPSPCQLPRGQSSGWSNICPRVPCVDPARGPGAYTWRPQDSWSLEEERGLSSTHICPFAYLVLDTVTSPSQTEPTLASLTMKFEAEAAVRLWPTSTRMPRPFRATLRGATHNRPRFRGAGRFRYSSDHGRYGAPTSEMGSGRPTPPSPTSAPAACGAAAAARADPPAAPPRTSPARPTWALSRPRAPPIGAQGSPSTPPRA